MSEPAKERAASDRFAGVALGLSSILSILLMAHHPSGGTGHTSLNQVVHGGMMVLVLVMLAGYVRFSQRRGLDRFVIVLAVSFYGASVVGNILAATINGFVAPSLAFQGASQEVLRLCWALNQSLAYSAVYAMGVAFTLWGADLLTARGAARVLGALGVAGGLATVAMLGFGVVEMNVAGAFVVYAVQAAFGVLVGAALVRGRA